MSEELNPITREEMFLAKAAGQNVPALTPITRVERFLQNLIDHVKSIGTGGGGSGGGAFYVTITGADGVYTADKTVAEITEAYEAGKLVYCNTPAIIDGVTVNALLPFVSGIEGILLFSCWINGMSCNAIYSTEGIEVITCDVATYIDIPMAMPNPQPIEFNGAVTGRYNGSEKVTITIPTVPTVADILAALPTWNGGSY